MTIDQDNSEHDLHGHRWRDNVISVALVGTIIAGALYSGRSPVRQEGGVEPSSTATEWSRHPV